MADMDPIHLKNAINLFPQLSETQTLNCYLFAAGANYQEISELRNKSPVSVKKTLEKAQANLQLHSVQSIRQVFLCRIFFNIIYNISTGQGRTSNLKSDMALLESRVDVTTSFPSLFPEIDPIALSANPAVQGGDTRLSVSEAG